MNHIFTAMEFFSLMVVSEHHLLRQLIELEPTKGNAFIRTAGTKLANYLANLANQSRDGSLLGRPLSDSPTLRLVFFRPEEHIGKHESEVQSIHKLPRYFNEVVPFVQATKEDIALRMQIAQSFGFLMLWPDESFVVRHKSVSTGNTFVDAFKCDELGNVKEVDGIYFHDTLPDIFEHHLRPSSIAELHVIAAKQVLQKKVCDLSLVCTDDAPDWMKRNYTLSPLEQDRLRQTIELLEQHIPNAPPKRSAGGGVVNKYFVENGSTASLHKFMKSATGWIDYPTYQDAWYYGVVINPTTLEVLTYAEGDVVHIQCETEAQFMADLKDLARFHGQNLRPSWIGYGPNVTLGFNSLTFIDAGKTVSAEGTEKIDQESPRNSHAGVMVDLSKAVMKRLEKNTDPQGTVLELKDGVDFQYSLLDPRSWVDFRSVHLTKVDDTNWKVNMKLADNSYQASLAILVAEAEAV